VLAGDVLNGASIFSHTNPLHGVLQLKSDGSFSYLPKRAFKGVDSFTYTLKNAAATSTGTVTIDVPARSHLLVSLSAPATAGPGSSFTYTLTVTNAGPDPTTALITRFVAPPGVKILATSPHATDVLGILTWRVPILAANGSVTYSISVRLPANAHRSITAVASAVAIGSIDPKPGASVAVTRTSVT